MDLKKLPPSMLVLLGLGCPGVQACLSPPIESAEASSSGVESNSVGPCLSPPADSGSEVGPCLGMQETTGSGTSGDGSSSGGSSSGGTSSSSGGSSSDSGTTGSTTDAGTTVGPCLAPPGVQPDDTPESLAAPERHAALGGSRRAALERVLARSALPADVVARLLGTTDPD